MVIEELKAKAGFGGAKLVIHIPKDKYKRDEFLKGEVLLLGGRAAQKIKSINVRLIREWNTEGYVMDMQSAKLRTGCDFGAALGPDRVRVDAQYELEGECGKDTLSDIELARDIEIHPEEKKNFPFATDLSNIRPEEGVGEKWKLQARADIPYAKDAVAEFEIKIVHQNKTGK